ncbi:MAG: DnaJ domain-containing protein [Pseudomonadota bacterium]
MISYFILGLLGLFLIILLMRTLLNAKPAILVNIFIKLGGVAALIGAAFLTLRGQFWLGLPLGIWGISLLFGKMGLPGFSSVGGPSNKTTGRASTVKTKYLEMKLDHDTNDMDGRILAGRFERDLLSSLTMEQLLLLYGDYRKIDQSSVKLLEAYLDRVHPDWRDHIGAEYERRTFHTQDNDGPLTREQAYKILGLDAMASNEDVRQAHRTLMKKFHPDQGGSTYLATKINEAKDLLLRE